MCVCVGQIDYHTHSGGAVKAGGWSFEDGCVTRLEKLECSTHTHTHTQTLYSLMSLQVKPAAQLTPSQPPVFSFSLFFHSSDFQFSSRLISKTYFCL